MLLLELFTLLVALAALGIAIYLWVDKKKNGLHPDIIKALNNLDDNPDEYCKNKNNSDSFLCKFINNLKLNGN